MTFWDDASSSSETLFGSHIHPRQISRVKEWTTAAAAAAAATTPAAFGGRRSTLLS